MRKSCAIEISHHQSAELSIAILVREFSRLQVHAIRTHDGNIGDESVGDALSAQFVFCQRVHRIRMRLSEKSLLNFDARHIYAAFETLRKYFELSRVSSSRDTPVDKSSSYADKKNAFPELSNITVFHPTSSKLLSQVKT